MKSIVKIAILGGLMAAVMPLCAQKPGDVYNESVVVTGSYRPEIEESAKLNVAPQITDTTTTLEHKFSYDITTKRLTSLFYPTRIKAARIIGEPTTRLYNNYFRLGMGNYWSPLAEFYFNSTRHQKVNYGAYASHHSSWGTIGKDTVTFSPDYYGKNYWSQTDVGAFGKFILGDKVQLSTDIYYNNDLNLLYGFSDSLLHRMDSVLGYRHSDTINYRDSLRVKDYHAVYNLISWNLGVKSLKTEKFGYSANFNLSDLWATHHQNELRLNLEGDVRYAFAIKPSKGCKGVAYLHLDWAGYKNNASPDGLMPLGWNGAALDTLDSFRNIVRINPYVDFLIKSFNVHAGLTMGIENYSAVDSMRFHIFPDVSISKSFMKEALNLSLGAEGSVEANDLNSIRLINPYIAPYTMGEATSHYDFYLRFRVNFSKKLQLRLYGEYNIFRNDQSFLLDTNYVLANVYQPFYHDCSQIKTGGEFSFLNDELLQLSVGGNYYYHADSLELYKPNWDAHMNLALNIKDKWIFHLQGLVMGSVKGMNVVRDANNVASYQLETLPLRYGVNFDVEYRHNRALSFFVKFDNLAFQRYYYWTNYPSQKMTFIAGLTYTILSKKH